MLAEKELTEFYNQLKSIPEDRRRSEEQAFIERWEAHMKKHL